MNIVIINQPVDDRGDEAAHKSLMRSLVDYFPHDHIYVVFQGVSQKSIDLMKVDTENVVYVRVPYIRGCMYLMKIALICNLVKFSSCLFSNSEMTAYIKMADIIICAPGGIDMGVYKNWPHVYWLAVAKAYKKKIAYYSRSFGPFPANTFVEKKFRQISIELLNYFDFLSIRDAKTMDLANHLHIRYISSVDTAFLDNPQALIPPIIEKKLKRPYCVFGR